MGEWIKSIHHINVKANGIDKFEEAVKFYTELLGMELIRKSERPDGGRSAMISAGNCCMEIGTADDVLAQGAIRHFALLTDRIEEITERVRAAGYRITKEPSEPGRPLRVSFCIGPCGEEIEFYQTAE